MFDLDKWNEIWLTINKHRLRTFLTCFGVGWGIFMLVVMLGASTGFENGVMSQLDIARNSVFIWSNKTSMAYKGLQPGRYIRFTNEDVPLIRSKIPELEVLAPRNDIWENFTVSRKQKSASFNAYGDYPEFIKIKPMTIIKGRFLNEKDLQERRKIAVVGEEVVNQLFEKDENPIGQYIEANGIPFKIVGIFRGKGTGEDVMEDKKTIYFPHTTVQQAFHQGNQIFWFGVLPKPGVSASFVEQRVKEVLAESHQVHPEDLKAFGSFNFEQRFGEIQSIFIGMKGFSWFVSIGAILAGIIGVSNIMLIVVKERTKEIGVRKALGATPWSIISLILQESIVLTAVAGYLGLLFGVGFVEMINQLLKATGSEGEFFANPEVDLNVAIVSTFLLVFFGGIAGLIPATKAARVNPVVALSDE
ncbi:MAG: ABC transporter permease [Microscillaceae bacterium]|nr:ABC transporter permease [Microscillaceae bacterium]